MDGSGNYKCRNSVSTNSGHHWCDPFGLVLVLAMVILLKHMKERAMQITYCTSACLGNMLLGDGKGKAKATVKGAERWRRVNACQEGEL